MILLKNAIRFKQLLTIIIVLFFTLSATRGISQTKKPHTTIKKDSLTLSYKIIDGANGTYGYDIYQQGRLMVHQPSIPAVSGNAGFTTKEKAQKVASLVIGKIKKGEMPPTVSIEEIKKLKAL